MVANCAGIQGHVVQVASRLVHLLHNHEHAAELVADVAACADSSLGCSVLGASIIRDIGRMETSQYARANSGVHQVSELMTTLSLRHCTGHMGPVA